MSTRAAAPIINIAARRNMEFPIQDSTSLRLQEDYLPA
jgi:hypothetical protein